MKQTIFLSLLIITVTACAQKSGNYEKKLESARGHYKDLETFSRKPSSSTADIDKQTFPYDETSATRRLSLKPYYLENVPVEEFKIPDPPANSSNYTRAELNYLLALQSQRSSPDIQQSLYMAGVYYNPRVQPSDSTYAHYRKNLFFIGRSIGSWFNADSLPVTANLLANVWRDASYFIWSFKYKYARIRPYVIDPSIDNLEETNWAAYPSGHASNSYVNAYVFTEFAPQFEDFFMKDAYDMAHSREIIGVHYPSDSEAGRIFARQFVNKLFQNEKFLRDFSLAQKEWEEKARESFKRPAIKEGSSAKTTSCSKTCD